MKLLNSLFIGALILSTQNVFASGTGDIGSGTDRKIVAQCGTVAVDVEVSVQGNQLLIDITGSEGTMVRYTRTLAEGEKINGRSLTTYAIGKVVDSHNVIGIGPMITINGSEGILADGAIHALSCRDVK